MIGNKWEWTVEQAEEVQLNLVHMDRLNGRKKNSILIYVFSLLSYPVESILWS